LQAVFICCRVLLVAKPKNERVKALTARVPSSLYERVVRFRTQLAREQPGLGPSINDTVCVLLERALKGASL
jgi:hypothetical protein